jgi:HYDIN/CFA65/VesB-like, Ig-like domain
VPIPDRIGVARIFAHLSVSISAVPLILFVYCSRIGRIDSIMLSRASRALVIILAAAFCATAALAQWSVAAQKKPVGKVAVKPKSLKFGQVSHTVVLQFNIQNTGTAPVSGSVVSTNNTPFTINSGSSSFGPLDPGGSYAVTVQCAPAKKGSYASTITIVSNAKNAKVKVAMTGSAKVIATPTPTPTTSPTPTSTSTATPSPSPTPTPISTPSLALGGSVAGPDPISGAQVTAWAIGTTGYSQGATPLACVTTDANGNFAFGSSPGCGGTLSTGFLCSDNGEQIYLIAAGGTASGQPVPNPQIALLTALGPCGIASASNAVVINELSTIASVYALAQFISPAAPYAIGAPSSNAAGLSHAVGTITNLIDPAHGVMPGPNLPLGSILPTDKIDTLAATLAACVESSGTQTGSPSPCNELMCDAFHGAIYNSVDDTCALPTGATPPTDTLGATIAIATHPGAVNVADLCTLASAEATRFASTIACNSTSAPPSPTDWTLALNFTGGGINNPRAIAIDAAGNVWIANEYSQGGTGSITEYSPTGALLSPATGYVDPSFYYPVALAIDASGNVWIANAIGDNLSELNASGQSLDGAGFVGGGLHEPSAIAIDYTGNVWVANNTSNVGVSKFATDGAALSPVTGYGGSGIVSSRALAVDAANHVWVINTLYSGSSANQSDLAELDSSGTLLSPSGGYTGGGLFSSTALALDAGGNVWVTNEYGGPTNTGSLSRFGPAGAPLSPATGYTGGGLSAPNGLAIDGKGNVWIVNNSLLNGLGNSLSEFSSVGAPLSTATGYTGGGLDGPLALAIDAAGNLWVINNTNTESSVSEFIGAAAPVKTPLLGLPQQP